VATIVADGLELCVDCVQLTANGELGQGDADADEAHDERMTLWLAQYGDDTNLVLACDEDCEGWFSSRQCDGCGSSLGGDRHPGAILA
jgi:hypothetical protein